MDRNCPVEIDQDCLCLENLLSETARPSTRSTALTRGDSLYLAAKLASSLLQLHATPWLPENWSNKSIYFSRPADVHQVYVMINFDQPHALHHSPTKFGLNPYLVSLGIILLELSERKSFIEWLNGRDVTTPPEGVVDKAMTAYDWFEEVCIRRNMSERYANVVHLCLKSAFPSIQMRPTFADEGFRDAVYHEIVRPLEVEYSSFMGLG